MEHTHSRFFLWQGLLRDAMATQDSAGKGVSLVPSSSLAQEVWSGVGGAEGEVAVLLSGGVDSSVALRLAMEQGLKPRCFYLKIWLEDELSHLNSCPWEEDWEYASAVARQCGVPLEAVSMQKEYFEQVVGHTVAEAARGRTPNPDILCNSRIKFGMFYQAVGRHFDGVVTGHYARKVPPPLHDSSFAVGGRSSCLGVAGTPYAACLAAPGRTLAAPAAPRGSFGRWTR